MNDSPLPVPDPPPSPPLPRSIRIGGCSKDELLTELLSRGIKLNPAAHALFAHEGFRTTPDVSTVTPVAISVSALGYPQGAVTALLTARATELGLRLAPLELGPHFRLQYADQAEGSLGHPASEHRAPPGSLTIASVPLTEDDAVPKGFYLRRINGDLWLRGYWADSEHVWSPEDCLVFLAPAQ